MQQASTSIMTNSNNIGTPTTFTSSSSSTTITTTITKNKNGQLFEGTPPTSSSSSLMPYDQKEEVLEEEEKKIIGTEEVVLVGLNSSSSNNINEKSNCEKSIVVQLRPQPPPKPQQIDIVRYSMQNMVANGGGGAKDEFDLDTILSELLELENQLSGDGGDHLIHGLPTLPQSQSQQKISSSNSYNQQLYTIANDSLLTSNTFNLNSNKEQGNPTTLSRFGSGSEAELIASRTLNGIVTSSGDFVARSPDVDSAFGDSSSTECSSGVSSTGNGNTHSANSINGVRGANGASGGNGSSGSRNSQISSADSYRGSLNTPSPTHQISSPLLLGGNQQKSTPINNNGKVELMMNCTALRAPSVLSASASGSASNSNSNLNAAEIKAQKIREALEKMKEAKMKKIFVKIFLEDGTARGILIDERWTVGETMRQIGTKLGVVVTPEHAIVEEYPDLFFKRIYEDQEFVVENIEDWLAESKNKLYFIRVADKYDFISSNPQNYLISEKSNMLEQHNLPGINEDAKWTPEKKQQLIETFLAANNQIVPELEGWLLLKADGKKSWKKHYFVLRSSGLYYYPKSGKMRGIKDLQCLMNVYNNQVYTCTDWKKKYKSPTNFGFSIKHPRIQVKTSKYIKYICAEDEKTFKKWVAALRITRNGFQTLYKNYCNALENFKNGNSTIPIRVQVPQISLQRLSSLTTSSANLNHSNQNSEFNSNFNNKILRNDYNNKSNCTANNLYNNNNNNNENGECIIKENVKNLSKTLLFSKSINCNATTGLTIINNNNNNELREYSPTNIVFDQDECGTIKRQPGGVSELLSNLESPTTIVKPFINELSSQAWNNYCNMNPGTSNIKLPNYNPNLTNVQMDILQQQQQQQDGDEIDSDEEQLPPPPFVIQPIQNHIHFQMTNDHLDTNRSPNFITPMLPPKPPTSILTPSSNMTPRSSNIIMSGVSSATGTPLSPIPTNTPNFATSTRKIAPPPPPPKRSETTHLQSPPTINPINGSDSAANKSMNLLAELQRATARQKQRIEGN